MNKQLLLVKFPIIFPFIYGSILYLFPSFETQLIFITILILAETHFGATWPFFLTKSNIDWIKGDIIKLIVFPLSVIIFSLVGFFLFKNLFLMIFFIANVYHVTRQSYGVCKLYCKNISEIKFQEYFIYFFNFLFFLVAFFRFYYPVIESNDLLNLNLFILILFIIVFASYIYKYKYSQNFLTFVTGSIIFYPTCFVTNPVHSIIMGVTMHYSQYLYLTNYVVKNRDNDETNIKGFRKNFLKNFLLIIVIYSLLMTTLSLFGKSSNINLSSLIIIPIIGQMLHFYLDSQLWKFSLKHNRENVLKYLVKIIE